MNFVTLVLAMGSMMSATEAAEANGLKQYDNITFEGKFPLRKELVGRS